MNAHDGPVLEIPMTLVVASGQTSQLNQTQLNLMIELGWVVQCGWGFRDRSLVMGSGGGGGGGLNKPLQQGRGWKKF